MEGKPVRAKLALVVAAAVVFAPGWPASHGSTAGPAGEALTGRILAPTVDEASIASHAAAAKAKRLERPKQRAGSWKTVAWRSSSSSFPSPAPAWVPLVAVAAAAAFAVTRSSTSPRAPPYSRTV